MNERKIKVVDQLKYRGRWIVIVSIKWNPKIKKMVSSLHNYHCGYVSVSKFKQITRPDYRDTPNFFGQEELTYSGTLDNVEELDEKLRNVWFLGFDTAHFHNQQNPRTTTKRYTTKAAMKLCDAMIRREIWGKIKWQIKKLLGKLR